MRYRAVRHDRIGPNHVCACFGNTGSARTDAEYWAGVLTSGAEQAACLTWLPREDWVVVGSRRTWVVIAVPDRPWSGRYL